MAAPVKAVINYSGEQFENGKTYQTIKILRSTISAGHEPVDGSHINQNLQVWPVMKGAFVSRPPAPCYTSTWEVADVLEFLRRSELNDALPLTLLGAKVAFLLALTGTNRVYVLSAFDCRFMTQKYEGILFSLPVLCKTQRVCQGPKDCFFLSFKDDSRLCPCAAVLAFVERTKSWGKERGADADQTGFCKSH